jgi:hypothetical protein
MNQFISLSTAIEMTTLYRNQKEGILKPGYQGQNILPISESFDRNAFDSLLAQSGCEGLRIYYGMSEDFKIHAIIVGVNASGEDMLPDTKWASDTEAGDEIIENGNRCPDLCPPASPLNE